MVWRFHWPSTCSIMLIYFYSKFTEMKAHFWPQLWAVSLGEMVDATVNGTASSARCTLWVQDCTGCCEEQSDIWNMAPGLEECTEIIYVHETMRKWHEPSFHWCLLQPEVQAMAGVGGEGVERREGQWVERESLKQESMGHLGEWLHFREMPRHILITGNHLTYRT